MEFWQQDFLDPLTKLLLRPIFFERLRQLEFVRTGGGGHAAAIYVDLDGLNRVNTVFGYASGDALLAAISKRLRRIIGANGVCGRLNGDEFGILLLDLPSSNVAAQESARMFCESILTRMSQPFRIDGREHVVGIKMGLHVIDDSNACLELEMQHAEGAMLQAKQKFGVSYCQYDSVFAESLSEQQKLIHDLYRSLKNNQLELDYQPQVDYRGALIGAEALLRWRHPERGLISPAQFIPLAERSGFIIDIGEWLLSQACSLLSQWEKNDVMREATLAINVSAVEFRNAAFVSNLTKAVSAHDLKPGRLKLELTEGVMALDLSELSDHLNRIKELGVLLALDDFGTGYSSMSYLRALPIDQLKIDKSFLDQIVECQRDIIIVRGIVDLGKQLGFSVIAEGVETQQQLDVLLRCGCLQYQGYLTGRPMTEAELYSKFAGSEHDLHVQ